MIVGHEYFKTGKRLDNFKVFEELDENQLVITCNDNQALYKRMISVRKRCMLIC